jgi:hypothetical protein
MYGGIGDRIHVFLRGIEEYFYVFAELFTGEKIQSNDHKSRKMSQLREQYELVVEGKRSLPLTSINNRPSSLKYDNLIAILIWK